MNSKYPALLFLVASAAQAKTPVKLAFVEALAPRDSTSSERFQRDYENAISFAKRETAARLAKCGYELQTSTAFYAAGDPLQAKEVAEKAIKDGAWMIVGPRRSNHYLLLAQGAPETPTVSLMASAKEVDALAPLHLSLSPNNAVMAKVAAVEARKPNRRTYLTVVSEDCVACRDFAESFDTHADSLGMKKLGELKIAGETPDLTGLKDKVTKLNPDIVLAPNYSKSAARIMAALEGIKPKPFFVGGDGWGDDKHGFVQNGEQIPSAEGITVRGLPPLEIGMKSFALGRKMAKAELGNSDAPWSTPGLAIVRLIDTTVDLLCSERPSSSAGFVQTFKKRGKVLYSAPWGVSVYRLKNSLLNFEGTRKAKL